jgi:hypothetical protein
MGIYSSFSLQNVKGIEAKGYLELASAPLIISFSVDDAHEGGWSDITIHTDNRELTLALVEAINGAVRAVLEKQAAQLAA